MGSPFGPIIIGTALGFWIYGIITIQAMSYFTICATDRWFVKCLVVWVLLVCTAATAMDVVAIWRYSITYPGEFGRVMQIVGYRSVMNVLVSSAVQAFYAWRIVKLTGKNWVYGVFGVLISVVFGANVFYTVYISRTDNLPYQALMVLTSTAGVGLPAIVDVIITITLTWYLLRNRTGFPQTDDVMAKFARMYVQTGIITTIWLVVHWVVCSTLLVHNTGFIFNLAAGKVHVVMLFSMLNCRQGWGKHFTTKDTNPPAAKSDPTPQSTWAWRSGPYTTHSESEGGVTTSGTDELAVKKSSAKDLEKGLVVPELSSRHTGSTVAEV